ncbi:probable histone-lysine N-methyltransferase Mes-4 [Glossina fuscipes]|uniref:Probable histone-lysine N-methyltransferase Mes-4 n=1 Tax=Glossina fuscipes TaxID=7396 RepID=A0A9C5Z9A8_9MUSC|nr:probable histone-lysine N-methyltransferase Mes-4 [Glossina fuscipes]
MLTSEGKKNPLRKIKSYLNPRYIGIKSAHKFDHNVGAPKRGRERRSMNTFTTSPSNISKLNRSDDMSAKFIASNSMFGFVRRTPRKEQENESSPKIAKQRKKFISPIDKLLKKNGSLVEALTTPNDMKEKDNWTEEHQSESNQTEKNNHIVMRGSSPQGLEGEEEEEKKLYSKKTLDFSKASIDALEEYGGLSMAKFSDIQSESHNEEVAGDIPLAKSPSAFSTDSAKGSSIANEGSWLTVDVGDVFWGQIYKFCFWPCMACSDPDSDSLTKDDVSRSVTLIHVRFFADNGRRNWVKRENLIPFVSLENYMEHVEDVKEKFGNKGMHLKAFLPTKRKESLWRQAINEACLVTELPHSDRLKKFHEIFEESKLFQKLEKQRRKSMHVYRAESTTDTGSLYGSNDAINVNGFAENFSNRLLHNFSSIAQKRDRSSSPLSPAYSPHKPNKVKRPRLSVGAATIDGEYTISTHYTVNSVKNNGDDLFKLYGCLREFVLENTKDDDEALDRSVFAAARNIYALREVNRARHGHHLLNNGNQSILDSTLAESFRQRDDGVTKKRLSNRLKNLMVQKTLSIGQSPDLFANASPALQRDSFGSRKVVRKTIHRPIEEVINDIFDLDSKYLFRGLSREPVCRYCFKPGKNLKKCSKECRQWLHKECLPNEIPANVYNQSNDTETEVLNTISAEAITHNNSNLVKEDSKSELICQECSNNEPLKCLICNSSKSQRDDDPLITCSMQNCERAFHPSCCKHWPHAKRTYSKKHIESFRCPSHVCHTCVSDNPKEKFQQLSNAKIVKCVKCPASYHCYSSCIPAGSQILSAAYIICPSHTNSKSDMTINVNWCFICVEGGQLVCCETCPVAVHVRCLERPIDNNAVYICDECESGRKPLYGEIVWAKFNNFRWWPAIILPPPQVPQNIAKMPHSESDFVVRFFGTNDHGWISRRRVYLYVEGDCSRPPRTKSSLDARYTKGVEEAKRIYEIISMKKSQLRLVNKEKLHPQPFVRIKTNRAVSPVKLQIDIEKVSKCNCKASDQNPCGPYSNCLNRVLFNECNPKICPAKERCQNQMFESRISPRLDVVHMKDRGFGLVCREFIPAGAFVIEYVGEVINDDEFKARLLQKTKDRDENFYFLSVEKDYIIDAEPKGNLARFMNHSCDPNCETQKWVVNSLVRIGLFAIKDIQKDTELTFNYHWDDLMSNKKKICLCGSKNCSRQIGAKPKEIADIDVIETATSSVRVKSKAKAKVKAARKLSRKSASSNNLKMSAKNLKTEFDNENNDQGKQTIPANEKTLY